MTTPLSVSPLVVAHDEGGLPIAADIRHLMSRPNAKLGVEHPVGAIVENQDITDLEEEEEEDSSDESRGSSIDDTMTAGLGLSFARSGDGTRARVLSPPPKAPRARMLSLPSMDEEEDMIYRSFVPTPVAEGVLLNSDSLAAKLAKLQDTSTDLGYHRPVFFAELEDDMEFSLEPEEISMGQHSENEGATGGAILGLQT